MKKFFLSLVVFSALYIIGCAENSITDPNAILSKDVKPAGTINSGSIPLKGMLVVPGFFTNYYTISGQLFYTHELARIETVPPRNNVRLRLAVKAELFDGNSQKNLAWTISGETEDNFYVSEDGIYVFEKSFTVNGRKDGLRLVCRFLATTDGVGLNSMWLTTNSTEDDVVKKNSDPGITYPPSKITRAQ